MVLLGGGGVGNWEGEVLGLGMVGVWRFWVGEKGRRCTEIVGGIGWVNLEGWFGLGFWGVGKGFGGGGGFG
jgi:hypothetical protein